MIDYVLGTSDINHFQQQEDEHRIYQDKLYEGWQKIELVWFKHQNITP